MLTSKYTLLIGQVEVETCITSKNKNNKIRNRLTPSKKYKAVPNVLAVNKLMKIYKTNLRIRTKSTFH